VSEPNGRIRPGTTGSATRPADSPRQVARRLGWVIACGWLTLTGCATTPPATTLPSPPDRVGVSAWLEPLAKAKLSAYAQSIGVPTFDLEVWGMAAATQAAEDGRLQLLISAAPPPAEWFATPLGFEAIAVVASPTIPVRDLSLGQVGEVFSGSIQTWDEFDGPAVSIQVVIPPEGDEFRQQFEMQIMDGRRFPRTALVAPTPEAMLSLLSDSPNAIGILPLSYPLEGVRALSVDGRAASHENLDQTTYPLFFEVVATAPREPQGGVRDWLAWIQGHE
jgi:ABC-type phosphate transport system substrate-binding protein